MLSITPSLNLRCELNFFFEFNQSTSLEVYALKIKLVYHVDLLRLAVFHFRNAVRYVFVCKQVLSEFAGNTYKH